VILVTGATGFIGPKVVHALRARDHDVRCLVRRPAEADQLRAWGCELAEGDMTDAESLRGAVDGCETVIHLVAIIQGKPEQFERIMARGTRDLVEASRGAGVRRFILMSALGTSPETKELTPYFRAKWEMEQTVTAETPDYVVFRPSFVFAPDGGVLPTFIRLVRYSPVIPVIGPGTTRLQPIWVDEVAEYFAKAVELPGDVKRIFEIGGPDAVTWNELYDRIRAVLGKRRPKIHVPFGVMRASAAVLEVLPGPTPVTRDQLKMLAAGDNVCDNGPALEAFGIELTPLNEQLRRAV
jgi:uncharacterized protein YbjT (DUF2867 family)